MSKKINHSLNFRNVLQLEKQGNDLKIIVEELQIINQSLSDNEKVKEDVLANLYDQLLVLSEEYDLSNI